MSAAVTSLDEALSNIDRFQEELEKSDKLRERLKNVRYWYAHQAHDGSWHFASAKFAGHKGVTAERYVSAEQFNTGPARDELGNQFIEVKEDSGELYYYLRGNLVEFLRTYGRLPEASIEIWVTIEQYYGWKLMTQPLSEQEIADLLIAISRNLNAAERARVRDAL